MWEWVEIIFLLVPATYFLAVLFGWTCFKHTWHEHGPTSHMAHDTKTGKIIGWKRMWWVCDRCGAKRHGRKIEK
jgi:hypothetical protein